jgi:hypothetical protein
MAISPQPNSNRFSSWYCQSVKFVPEEIRKGFNSLIILVAWEIWKLPNQVLQAIANECILWCLAGAKDLHFFRG